ncbi:uncharacterized protein LOC111322459 [Stylophora pistillata]|uniref:Uncharacterized protein n=1 Tax=Stylophora pistillata TaxID=50429 RepID=A0A2B4SKP4_STYPI|nr:uncharacterized protein LOC111322459 [Stylophora pistillata]PFX31254.1 hypothetical protein AWC38_SpisGene3945 [Stylophora pistillata]
MKIVLVSCFLIFASVSVAFVNGRYLIGKDLSESLEDELNELEPWELEDPKGGHKPRPVKSLKGAIELLLACFQGEHGQMKAGCMEKFKKALPQGQSNNERVIECVKQSFQECEGEPTGHKPINCIMRFKRRCMKDKLDGSDELDGSGR